MLGSVFFEEIKRINDNPCIPWEAFRNKTFFITGASGLIGTTLIYGLDYANSVRNLGLKIIALVRNLERAHQRFGDLRVDDSFSIVQGNVEDLSAIDIPIDYIVHAASQTASKEFVCHAVETIQTSVLGTIEILKLAKEKKSRVVYLSSMEVYGHPEKGHRIDESEIGAMSPLDLRNSYPISKVMAESLCCAYASEYGVHASIIRLAQTYGVGVSDYDKRIFAYFADCVREKKNIVLKTRGETERCYLHTNDAVSAILAVLVKGRPGYAYNAADEDSYCSIAEMAQKIAEANDIKLEFDIQDEKTNGFPQAVYLKLDTSALKALGWIPVQKGLPSLC